MTDKLLPDKIFCCDGCGTISLSYEYKGSGISCCPERRMHTYPRPSPRQCDVEVEALRQTAIKHCTFASIHPSGNGYEASEFDTHQIYEGAKRMFDYLLNNGHLSAHGHLTQAPKEGK